MSLCISQCIHAVVFEVGSFFERLFNLNYIYVCYMCAQSRMLSTMELELPADVSCPLWVLELNSAPLQEQ